VGLSTPDLRARCCPAHSAFNFSYSSQKHCSPPAVFLHPFGQGGGHRQAAAGSGGSFLNRMCPVHLLHHDSVNLQHMCCRRGFRFRSRRGFRFRPANSLPHAHPVYASHGRKLDHPEVVQVHLTHNTAVVHGHIFQVHDGQSGTPHHRTTQVTDSLPS